MADNDQLAHITQEMYVKNMELALTNKTLSLLRAIDLLVLNSHANIKDLCAQLAETIGDGLGTTAVILLSLDTPSDKYLHFQGWSVRKEAANAGTESVKNQLELTSIPTDSQLLAQSQKTIILDSTRVTKETGQDAMNLLVNSLIGNLGIKTLYLTKLVARNNTVGVMGIGSTDSGPKLDDIALYERLGEALGVALDNKLLFDENQRVAKELALTNQKLKELDAAKDEFISMASHQLRTPLTAIKGYLSLVLEGDVGPVTMDEKTMLKRAYDSAQKMVYLIADLLNVSRLQSGKFIIENKPTNLAEITDNEVGELLETAKNRKIKLIYQKPANFPNLLLDENKIRQVIMNFMDNAIYYTPEGGSVTVAVTEANGRAAVTVTDTGVGVPKDVQPKLFAKFYRADNARKMRPDGTGLGLFMAKKVIDAQGGQIIFQSQEGKGSIFGFSFPLSPPTSAPTPKPPTSVSVAA